MSHHAKEYHASDPVIPEAKKGDNAYRASDPYLPGAPDLGNAYAPSDSLAPELKVGNKGSGNSKENIAGPVENLRSTSGDSYTHLK